LPNVTWPVMAGVGAADGDWVGPSVGALVWPALADGRMVGVAGAVVAPGLGDWAAMPQPVRTIVSTATTKPRGCSWI
jgi:hypothetical protein